MLPEGAELDFVSADFFTGAAADLSGAAVALDDEEASGRPRER
jgi:hypothetical protein